MVNQSTRLQQSTYMTKHVDSDLFGEEMRNFAIDLFML